MRLSVLLRLLPALALPFAPVSAQQQGAAAARPPEAALAAPAWAPGSGPLVAVAGPLAPERVALLRKALPFHGDHAAGAPGGFVLLQAQPRQLAWLGQHGFPAAVLGPWPEGRELAVVEQAELPRDATLLLLTHTLGLVVLEEGSSLASSCLHGTRVPPVPASPARRFARGTGGAQALSAADSRLTPLVAQVSAAGIEATVTQLSSYFTRRADSAQVLLAKDWLVAQLQAIPGLSVSTESFSDSFGPNIVATKTGSVHPERLVILGAHYDSINAAGSSFTAPGADDNASGSGGLLEAARVLAQGDFENTLRFTWFCAEEFGLLGSEAMAAALDAAEADVVAMLNMDMIAHRESGDAFDLDFATNNTDPALVQFCRDITAAYAPDLPTVTGVLTAGSSDHAPFNSHGFPAAFYFEDLGQFSQVIHTANDTLPDSPNDFTLARRITQSFVAAAGTLASPVDLALTHVAHADSADAGGPYGLSVHAVSLTAASVETVEVHWSSNGGEESSAPLLPGAAPGTWVGSLPGLQGQGLLQGELRYWLLATDSAGFTQWLPEALAPGEQTFSFSVGTFEPVFTDGFEGPGDNGWTHAELATQDDWQRGVPQGKSGDPASAWAGSSAWGNDLGLSGFNGAYQPDVDNYLESPAIDCTGRTGLHLRYRRWLGVEDALYDQASIAVNGVTVWQNLATPGGGAHTLDSAWLLHDVDVSAQADNQPSVKLRFALQSDGGLQFGGWTLDDVALVSVGPGTTATLTASALHLSGAGGGSLALTVDAGPAFAGRNCVLLLSASGSSPGTPLGSVLLPLNFDSLTTLGLQFLNTPTFANFGSQLDGAGRATATFVSPPIAAPALAGIELRFAACTLGPIDFATNAVSVQYQP